MGLSVFLYFWVLALPLGGALAEAPVLTPESFAFLEIEVVTATGDTPGIVAPPPGTYVFNTGDAVVLHAYDRTGTPVSVSWSGDVAAEGSTLLVEMTESRKVIVDFTRASREHGKEFRCFDVPDRGAVYAFLGGGNLYAWFVAERNKERGAGITHITHQRYPWAPFVDTIGLNFEHILSGAAKDNARAAFTPRLDPMRFALLSPGAVRVWWPAEESRWAMDCEMTYAFSGGDGIDLAFSVTPQDETFPMDYVAFMFATYAGRTVDRAIHFPGMAPGEEGWITVGPEVLAGEAGGTVPYYGATPLGFEDDFSMGYNLLELKDIFFTAPLYYGRRHGDTLVETEEDVMTYAMMFDQSAPLRFAVWNWGDTLASSAWDWQYVIQRPERNQHYGFRGRMIYGPSMDRDDILECHASWRAALPTDRDSNWPVPVPLEIYPKLPMYWSPSDMDITLFNLDEHEGIVPPALQLQLHRLALASPHNRIMSATALDRFYEEREDQEGIITEWRAILEHYDQDALPFLHLGKAYHNAGNLEAAGDVLRKGTALWPENGDLLLRLARVEISDGAGDVALDLLERAAAANPDLASDAGDAIAAMAAAAFAQRDFNRAEHLYRNAMRIAPGDLWHTVHLGETLERLGEDDQAAASYVQVLRTVPQSPYTANKLDALLIREGREARTDTWRKLHLEHPLAAIPLLYLGKAHYDGGVHAEALVALEKAVLLAPELAEAVLYLGVVKIISNEKEDGIALITRAVEMDSTLGGAAGTIMANRAEVALNQGSYEEAETCYRLAVELNPEDIGHRLHLGETLEKRGDLEQAALLYRQALLDAPDLVYAAIALDGLIDSAEGRIDVWRDIHRARPGAAMPLLHLGRACYDAGLYADAVIALEKAQVVAPETPAIQLYLGGAKMNSGDPESGIALVTAAVEAEPDLAPVAGAMAAHRGATMYAQAAYEQAARLYREAMNLDSKNTVYRVHLGESLEKQGEVDEAIECYKEALIIAPDLAYAAVAMDAILIAHRSPDVRIHVWRDVHNAHPKMPIPLLYLGKAHYDAGILEEAHRSLENALAFAGDLPEAALYLGAVDLYGQNWEDGLRRIADVVASDASLASVAGALVANHGQIAFDNQEYVRAEVLYREAMGLAPGDLWHAIRIAETLEQLGNHAQALSLYRKVLETAPEAPYTTGKADELLRKQYSVHERMDFWLGIHEAHPDAALPAQFLEDARKAVDMPTETRILKGQ